MKNRWYITIEKRPRSTVLHLKGLWRLERIAEIELSTLIRELPPTKPLVWDVSEIEGFDSAGVLLFREWYEKSTTLYDEVSVRGYTPKQKELYLLLSSVKGENLSPKERGFFEGVGRKLFNGIEQTVAFITFLGHFFATWWSTLLHPSKIRWKEIAYHLHQSGWSALLIIGLTSFLVGMVIAYQGSVQLAKFGADMFIVETVGISITRELGPMITAIVIAGRSGSAYTAEIGAMKITEEISAMRTMGFDPYHFLVLPRVIALMIALPLLIFFSDMIGIFGGMVASSMQLHISMTQFIDRLYEVLELKHYLLGMIKGPIFAFVIATIGCFRGFQVSDNTESIGLQTTASVVNGIFLVIAFDALFSVIYTEFGL